MPYDEIDREHDASNKAYDLERKRREEYKKTEHRREYTEKDRFPWAYFPYFKGKEIDTDVATKHMRGLQDQEIDELNEQVRLSRELRRR